MAINKNAQQRYLILDKCLRSGRKWTGKELLKKVNEELFEEINPKTGGPIQIGKTQLYEDLKDLEYRVYKAPILIEKAGRANLYSYEDSSYSIQNAPLNDTEIHQLKQAIQLISRSSGRPEFEFVHDLIPVLESKFGLIQTEEPVISYESNAYYTGAGNIKPLFEAIISHNVLHITYKDFKSKDPYLLTFHPYHLHQYNNRWFVFGYNPVVDKYNWNLALDRIMEIENSSEEYHPNDRIDWQEYFEDIIGVTKPEEGQIENIKLHFYGSSGRYIQTKPLHGSQRAKWIDEDTLEVRLAVIINYELERLLLSYAEQVKVLASKKLADSIKNSLITAAESYG